jgi:hypothetical protein
MNKIVNITASAPNENQVTWSAGENEYSFDANFNFTDAKAFIDLKITAVFHNKPNTKLDYVGKLFDFEGNQIANIPFPKTSAGQIGLSFNYKWSSEIEHGIKIIFATNSAIQRDFWFNFDFDTHTYISSGEAY